MFLRPRGRQSVAFSREAPLCAYVLMFSLKKDYEYPK